jgi:hypothetical protein
MEGPNDSVLFIRDPDVLAVPAGDAHVVRRKPRLDPERAPGPPLAGEAVTHRDPDRLALGHKTELSAATGRLAAHVATFHPSSPSDQGTAVPRLKIRSFASSPGKTPILSLSG